jgi:Rubredoxin-like zinc ribbon domain (DUF35_N)
VSADGIGVELSHCTSCQTRFLPTDGPCPRCGSTSYESYHDPGIGTVLSATELVHPAAGWESPHRLAFVELPQTVRLLAVVEGELPSAGALVSVRRDGELYRARTEPVAVERGEGESPRVGPSDASFEPPR